MNGTFAVPIKPARPTTALNDEPSGTWTMNGRWKPSKYPIAAAREE